MNTHPQVAEAELLEAALALRLTPDPAISGVAFFQAPLDLAGSIPDQGLPKLATPAAELAGGPCLPFLSCA